MNLVGFIIRIQKRYLFPVPVSKESVNVYCCLPLTIFTVLTIRNIAHDTVLPMKTYRGNESVAPLIRILDTR